MPAVFNPDEPFVEEAPRFDPSQPFSEEPAPRFDASKPFTVEGSPTETATTPAPSLHESLTSDLSSGDPTRIARAGQAVARKSGEMLNVGLAVGEQSRRQEIDTQASLQPMGTGSDSLAPLTTKEVSPAAPEGQGLARDAMQLASNVFLPLEAAGEFATKLGQDIISKITGDKRYGGNLAAWVSNPEMQSPAEKFIADAAKEAPYSAVVANVGKHISQMSPMFGMVAAPGLAGPAVSAGFAGQMGLSFYDSAIELDRQLGLPKEQQDAGVIAELRASLVSSGVFALLAANHARTGLNRVAEELTPRGTGIGGPPPLEAGKPLTGFTDDRARMQLLSERGMASLKALEELPPALKETAPLTARATAEAIASPVPSAPTPAEFKTGLKSLTPEQLTSGRTESERLFKESLASGSTDAAVEHATRGQFYREELENRADTTPKPKSPPVQERVVAATVEVGDVVGRGTDHAAAAADAATKLGVKPEQVWEMLSDLKGTAKSGFETSTGRLVDLDEAAAIEGKIGKASHASEIVPKPEPSPVPPVEPSVRYEGTVHSDWPHALVSPQPTGKGWRLSWFSEFSGEPGKLVPQGHQDYPTRDAAISAAKKLEYKPTSAPVEPPRAGNVPPKPTPPTIQGAGVEKSIASDWTSATEELPSKSELPRTTPPASGPEPMELHAGISIPKFANRKMSPLDQVTSSHSGKIQKSMSEARRAQKEIKKAVPSDRRQAAISIWREANGDVPTLQSWASAAKGKAFKQAAIDAQSLTPAEISIAQKAIAAFDVLEKRGNTFDVLKSHRDNYIPHVWDIKRPGSGFGTGMLKQRFKFSKARTFNTFFEGDQAGFKPKTLAIGKLLPTYIHEMNTVIADRQFVRDMVSGEAKDGSPLAVPRGNVEVVDGPKGKAVLVQPKSMREADTTDYRTMPDQPALSSWTWEGKDTDGNPVFLKADLALHPEAYRRVQAMLGQSAIRAWYRDPVSGTAQIPRALIRGLDTAQAAMKREMFGLLAPFHQVQEGTHAVGHTVNPFFGLEKIDLSRNPAQFDAANHGLMLLPDRASSSTYMEGVGTKASLLSRGIRKVPKAGEAIADVIDGYQDYLFHQYIPSLKFKTYEAMVRRNTKLYADELASGEMTVADIKITSAEQSNAAYGHLNYALLDRNPTIQHLIQMAALAPDFLEARVRFAGQGVKGLSSKVGHEQLRALALLAAAQAGTAFVLSNMLGVPYDKKHPFEVVYNGRRYAMRSVPEDIFGLLKDTRQFAYARVNPLTVKGAVQLATGLNYRGEKVTALDTMGELLAGYIPITARQLPGLRELTETSRNTPVTPLQQLAGSLGLRISRYSPISETYKLASDWKDSQKLPKDSGSYPVSKYQQLRYALEDGDMDRAKAQYDELLKTMPAGKIATGFAESINHPFTGSKASDDKFSKSLTGYDREMYDLAIRTRKQILSAFRTMPKK